VKERGPIEPPKPPVAPPSPEIAGKPAIMTRPANIYFTTGSATIDPNAEQLLDQVALLGQTYSNAYLRIEGNTDSRGDLQRNLALSEARAKAVVGYLVDHYGFPKSRFIPKGNGPNNPIGSNETEAGRAKNRRTEIHVIAAQ